MDDLSDRIAQCLGPRWSLLYDRLGLDYRGRFRIHARNEKMETPEMSNRQCTRDTIKDWRDASQQGVDELVVIARLLDALRTIQGMEELAYELTKLSGERASPLKRNRCVCECWGAERMGRIF